MVAREEEARREQLKGELERFVEPEPQLLEVFRCLWAGITKPAEIARRMAIEPRMVGVLRKKLERRMERFGEERKKTEGTRIRAGDLR